MFTKIALINCPMWDIEFPPYNIAFLAAVLRKNNFEADCFDLNQELYKFASEGKNLWILSDPYSFWQSKGHVKKIFESEQEIIESFIAKLESYCVLGFTVQSLNFIFSIELANIIKERFPEKILIAGGPECFRNFSPEHLREHGSFDAICCGEGELAFPELIFKIKNGQEWNTPGFFVKKNTDYFDCGDKDLVKNLNELPYADYQFLDKKTQKVSISTSRGCIGNCSFCHEKAHWNKYRWRSAESIIEEITLLKKQFPLLNFVYLNDSLINGNMKEFGKFCDLMIAKNMGINWGGHILVREEMTKDFLIKMKEAGAERLNFGVESGSNAVLKLMKKNFTRDFALRVLKDTKEANISFSVNLIIGHPGETEYEFEKTLVFFKEIKKLTDCIHINPCLILKNSELYNDHDKWGIALTKNYVTDWFLLDGTNNLQIRIERVNILKNRQGDLNLD